MDGGETWSNRRSVSKHTLASPRGRVWALHAVGWPPLTLEDMKDMVPYIYESINQT